MIDSKPFPSFQAKTEGEIWAIVPAAGSGVRMTRPSEGTPKQFTDLGGRPILARTLDVFNHLDFLAGMVVVLPADGFDRWRKLVAGYGHVRVRQIVPGGADRFESVTAGLESCPEETGVVVVHDGVRPLVDGETVRQSVETARGGCGAVTAIAAQDTLKRLRGGRLETMDRAGVYLIQTPQTFPFRALLEAYEVLSDSGKTFTDDAQLFEHLGWPLKIVAGSPENIKLTTPADLLLAEAIIRSRNEGRNRP